MSIITGQLLLETINYNLTGWDTLHNANMQKINDFVNKISSQNPVKSRLNTPPVSPALGDRHLVGTSPTGSFSGHANKIATWQGTAWYFATAVLGWLVFLEDEKIYYQYDGSAWSSVIAANKILGSIAAAGDLTLQSTSHASKGKVILDGELNHIGTKIGFFNTTPIVQPSSYTITNPVTRRSFDTTSVTLSELAEVLGTLIQDQKNYGLLQ